MMLGRASEMTAGGDEATQRYADWTLCRRHRALGTRPFVVDPQSMLGRPVADPDGAVAG
jgi:hypothetical protein